MNTIQRLFAGLLVAAAICFNLNMNAQYYWVGGSGNWTDYANHWATTSGGNTFHTQAPTEDDDVYFDANSFTGGGQTVTLNEDYLTCRSIDWTGVTNFPSVEQFNYDALWVYGSFTLSPDMTCNLNVIDMRSSESGNTIATFGNDLGNSAILRTNGEGTWTLMDSFTASQIQMSRGTLITNSNTVNISGMFSLNGTMSKTIDMGDSDFYCGQWRTWGSNNTISPGNYTVHTDAFYADEDGTGPYVYNNVTFNNEGCILEGTATFNQIDVSSTAGGWVRLESGETITFTDIVGTSTRHNPFQFESDIPSEEAFLVKNSGTLDLDYVILQDMHASGGATFNATNCLDLGNNMGWNISDIEPLSFYWVNDGGDWEDLAHWSSASGGSADYDAIPSRFDNVYIDGNSMTMAGQSIDINELVRVGNLDCTGAAFNPTFNAPYGNPLYTYGDVDFTEDVNKSIHNINFQGFGDHEVYLGSNGSVSYPSFWGGGSWTLMSDVSCATFKLLDGTVDLNDFNVTCNFNFEEGNFNGSTYYLGSGIIDCLNFKVQSEDAVINGETAKIIVRNEFRGLGHTYYHVVLDEEGIMYDENTMQYLEIFPGAIAKFEAEMTTTVTGQIFVSGVPDAPISIASTLDGTQATISLASGTVDGSYLILKDNAAIGGATFNADQSIDNGNNTGWNITEIVPLDYYWVGGTGDWSDAANHWAATSGGSDFYPFGPGALDDVYFDANSFSAPGQTVTLDVETANVHDIDWTGATNAPHFDGNVNTINIYGSLIFNEQMTSSVQNFNFLSGESEIIDPAFENSPGNNSYFVFSGGGEWDLQSEMMCRSLTLEAGTFRTNDYECHIDFATYFLDESPKVLDLGSSTYYSRSMQWNSFPGSNLDLIGGNSDVIISSAFSPGNFGNGENINLDFNNLRFSSENGIDIGSIESELTLNTLLIDAGKTVEIFNNTVIEVNQLIVVGTVDDPIILVGMNEGIQGVISQASGTVNGEYLELQDISGTGGATFYANNSINNGNVSGWIFTGQAQTISFDPLTDVLEDVGSYDLTATASSGLDVTFEVLSGPATIDGSTITITGPGPVLVQASQNGDNEYNPAPSVSHEFCSIPLQPTITSAPDGDSIILTSSASEGNQWYINGDIIDGETDVDFVATINGVYTVQVDVGGCVSEVSDDFSIIDLSIDIAGSMDMTYYPNPTSGNLWIQNAAIGQNIVLHDLSGKILSSYVITSSTQTIDLSNLASGIYFLSDSLNGSVSRVVKQ
jgi:hypothetical protein